MNYNSWSCILARGIKKKKKKREIWDRQFAWLRGMNHLPARWRNYFLTLWETLNGYLRDVTWTWLDVAYLFTTLPGLLRYAEVTSRIAPDRKFGNSVLVLKLSGSRPWPNLPSSLFSFRCKKRTHNRKTSCDLYHWLSVI